MCYTYVLRSNRDQRFYTGTARDLRARMKLRLDGRVRSTVNRRPLTLVHYEACLDVSDAFRRERLLKTGKGKRFLRNRLASFLAGADTDKLERH
jgi:putative endonuclease